MSISHRNVLFRPTPNTSCCTEERMKRADMEPTALHSTTRLGRSCLGLGNVIGHPTGRPGEHQGPPAASDCPRSDHDVIPSGVRWTKLTVGDDGSTMTKGSRSCTRPDACRRLGGWRHREASGSTSSGGVAGFDLSKARGRPVPCAAMHRSRGRKWRRRRDAAIRRVTVGLHISQGSGRPWGPPTGDGGEALR